MVITKIVLPRRTGRRLESARAVRRTLADALELAAIAAAIHAATSSAASPNGPRTESRWQTDARVNGVRGVR